MSAPSRPAPSRTPIAKVVGASLVGTTVEWYDFFLYGSAAALVFPALFFPESDPLTGTLLAFLTYAVGFVARPVGGVVFGHYGDKIGRKKLLVASLLIMGAATFLIGCLPTHAQVGALAPVLLVALRLVQGFALGGEWGGAVLIVSEHGDRARRGFWASWPQCGAPAGNLLATAVLFVLSATLGDAAFAGWGWRVPFLLSAVLVVVGLWVRTTIDESPVFLAAQRAAAEQAATEPAVLKPPLVQILRTYRREILVAIGARFAENVSYYVITAFVLTYITTFLELPKSVGLQAVLVGSAVHFVTIPLWGALSDRVGRRPVYLLGAAGVGAWGFVFFRLLDTRSTAAMILAVTVGLLFHGAMYGPQAALFSELFGTKVRYSGLSVGSQLSSIVAGSLAPVIAVALLREFSSAVPVAFYLLLATAVTVTALAATHETRHVDLADDHGFDADARRERRAPVGVA